MNTNISILGLILLGFALSLPSLYAGDFVKPIKVVKQQYFKKQMRTEVALTSGTILNNTFVNTLSYGVQSSFYFSDFSYSVERLG